MTRRSSRVLLPLGGWLAACALLLTPGRLPADPVPGKYDRLVIQLVCQFLQQAHIARPQIGDDLSRRLFKRFLKDLDPGKLYLLKSDVEEFQKLETELDDQVLRGDIGFAYQVYGRFVSRLNQRLPLVEELLKTDPDFTAKEYLELDSEALDWAKDEAELRERWRKRVKFDLLQHRIGDKPTPADEAKKRVQARYQNLAKRWKQVDNFELMELYLSALLASLDPHSSYMGPATLDDFDISMRLQLEGIGAVLRQEDGNTVVAEVVSGGAAAADGRLKVNDKIIAVAQGDNNFTDVVDMKLRDVVKLIRGKRGTPVQLRVLPATKGEPVVLDLTRQTVQLKDQEARADIVEQGKKADGSPYRVGVIDLPSFYADVRGLGGVKKSATEDTRRILKDFQAKGVDGVVLDLRRNGGGSLNEALALTGLFLDRGPIVQVKGFQGRVQRHDDPESGTMYGGPLLVLVSRFSASASEILAGAVQDYGRGLVVGDSATHGKGTVQTVLDLKNQFQGADLPNLGAIKLTIQQFYRVNGDSTQSRGVAADIVLPALTEHYGVGEKELDNALAFDKVKPVDHARLGMVSDELKAVLQTRSAERIKASKDFAKLQKDIEQVKARRAKKVIPLNEEELRERFSKEDAEKADQKLDGFPPEPKSDGSPYKFQKTYVHGEVLQIMEDFLQGRKLVKTP